MRVTASGSSTSWVTPRASARSCRQLADALSVRYLSQLEGSSISLANTIILIVALMSLLVSLSTSPSVCCSMLCKSLPIVAFPEWATCWRCTTSARSTMLWSIFTTSPRKLVATSRVSRCTTARTKPVAMPSPSPRSSAPMKCSMDFRRRSGPSVRMVCSCFMPSKHLMPYVVQSKASPMKSGCSAPSIPVIPCRRWLVGQSITRFSCAYASIAAYVARVFSHLTSSAHFSSILLR
mmetsp:Transcript_2640/g.9561  ORF Transcript_2640/g.9561 Transcript_2640/m.9561 type:complete len:236 (+) Transcript_2640:595-1302(+)